MPIQKDCVLTQGSVASFKYCTEIFFYLATFLQKNRQITVRNSVDFAIMNISTIKNNFYCNDDCNYFLHLKS